MNQRFNENKIENIPVFFSNLRQVKYLQAYLRGIRSLWLHPWLIAICLCEIDWLGRWRPRCAKRHARAHKHQRRRHWVALLLLIIILWQGFPLFSFLRLSTFSSIFPFSFSAFFVARVLTYSAYSLHRYALAHYCNPMNIIIDVHRATKK